MWLQTVYFSVCHTQMFSFPCGKHSKTCTVYNHPIIICVWFVFVSEESLAAQVKALLRIEHEISPSF